MKNTPTLTVFSDHAISTEMWTWWLAYINGFTIDQHCQRCFRGLYGNSGRRVSLSMPLNQPVSLDETSDYRHLYLCGVSHSGYSNNFHLAFEYAAGEPDIILPSAGGMTIVVENARRLEIPSLPDGWRKYTSRYTTCRNFQFAVDFFGADGEKTESRPWFLPNPPESGRPAQRLMF